MARKEQRPEKQSKSRMAMRQARGGQPASAAEAPVIPTSSGKGLRSKAKEGRGGTMIASCTCEHEYQDARYGSKKRVFNLGPNGGHCTVCGNKRSL